MINAKRKWAFITGAARNLAGRMHRMRRRAYCRVLSSEFSRTIKNPGAFSAPRIFQVSLLKKLSRKQRRNVKVLIN